MQNLKQNHLSSVRRAKLTGMEMVRKLSQRTVYWVVCNKMKTRRSKNKHMKE